MAIDASLLTQEEYYALKRQGAEFVKGMTQRSRDVYVRAVNHARAAGRTRGEEGMAEAVRMMAEEGVHAYSYARKDGTVVRVPADVGIRRAMREQMRRASSRNALDLAGSTGHDLVYIDETPACRDSHKPINGRAFSVSGSTPGYDRLTPELEALLSDYGCEHRVRLYWPGVTKTPEPRWRAEGYTDEEMRGLQSTQRALENAVRKAKRSSEALKAALAEAEGAGEAEKAAALSRQLTVANAKVRARQVRVAEHVAAHSDVLTRQPWREALYDSAARMGKTLEPGSSKVRVSTKVSDLVWKPAYTDRFKFVEQEIARTLVADIARRMLKHRGGTVFEDIAIVSVGTGATVAAVESSSIAHSAVLNSSARAAVESSTKGSLVMMHNHPQSMPPSAADFAALSKKQFRYGIIVCHDGSVIRIRVVNWKLFEEMRESARLDEINDVFRDWSRYYGTASGDIELASILERRFGVTYERYD